ncbi:MAG: acetyl-CoA hydrolase/transferase C-terminal domain-containing protein [Candidatus Alcyoniella australis]|nr:acetyl-CoA hydrolase/transferase C-terminal domain-containing protein [Candidatus Alcyoniella australis]
MASKKYPKWFKDCFVSNSEALDATIKSGVYISSGFATSEPHTFYDALWEHIQSHDLHDINIRQALFMAPFNLLVGDALQAKGLLNGLANRVSGVSLLNNIASRANQITQKLEGLHKLIEHFKELQQRKIVFVSAFMGPASNMVIPDNPITRLRYPEFVGRNKSRMGIVDHQSCHFPDAPDGMAYDQQGKMMIDVFALVMTPPNAKGDMSHGLANGANGPTIEIALQPSSKIKLVLYINKKYPFTIGFNDAPNTVNISRFKDAAKQGRLFLIEDDGKLPALPAHSFENPAPVELQIANNLVNHMEMHKDLTQGRAIQVGFGGTGVLAIRGLADSSWTGRMYTEMLEPFTMDLWEQGKIAGSHKIEIDGRRTMLDHKMVCTFTVCEEDSDFYDKLNNNPDVLVAPSSRVVIPEAFYYGLGINNILGIDFHAQVNSGGRDKNHYSGIGGAAQIMRGLARGGVAYLCLKSTHKTPEGKVRSSVFPFMPEGTPISMIGSDILGTRENAQVFLVTEHGVTKINAMSQANFIRNAISVAHPDYRDWLAHSAWEEFRAKI